MRLQVFPPGLNQDYGDNVLPAPIATGGGGSALEVLDEGVSLDSAVTSINVVGPGAVATNVGHAITLTAPFNGTVTSVGLTMPAGFVVSGSPVTTSGTLAVTGGASIVANHGIQFSHWVSATYGVATYNGMTTWSFTSSGGVSAASATRLGQTPRFAVQTTTAQNSIGGWHNSVASIWRGSGAGLGGFRIKFICGLELAPTATMKWFQGIRALVSIPAAAFVPSAAVDCVIFGCDSGDTTVFLMHNDSAGACTKINTGFAWAAGDFFMVDLECAGNGADITYSVTKDGGGAAVTGTISSNLPTAATFMGIVGFVNNSTTGTTATAATISNAFFGLDYPLYVPTP